MSSHDILFETERLKIRHWENTDVQDAFDIFGDPVVQQTLRFDGMVVQNIEQMASELALQIRSQKTLPVGTGNWAIFLPQLNKVIGSVCFRHLPHELKPVSGEFEVTWTLATAFWGQGYATEAAAGAVEYGFRHNPRLRRVVARCVPTHTASRQVAERIGMSFLGLSTQYGSVTLAVYELVNAASALLT